MWQPEHQPEQAFSVCKVKMEGQECLCCIINGSFLGVGSLLRVISIDSFVWATIYPGTLVFSFAMCGDWFTSQELVVILATRRQARDDPEFYTRVHARTGKSIWHIACAAGDSEHGRNRGGRNDASLYPNALALRRFHSVPVNYENPMRNHNMYNFWVACKQTVSEEGGAVLVHCNNSYHRAPALLACLMIPTRRG